MKALSGRLDVDKQLGHPLLRRDARGGRFAKGAAKAGQLVLFDLQPGRRRVTAVRDQELAALGQRGVQIEPRHAPRRADARPHPRLVPGDHHHRAVEAVGQPPGHDADHARMPAAIGQHQGGVFDRIERFLGLFGRGKLNAPLQGLPRGVQSVDVLGQLGGPLGPVGHQQFHAQLRLTEPAGGVQPRGDLETQVFGVQPRLAVVMRDAG